jgi:hypothetical protein
MTTPRTTAEKSAAIAGEIIKCNQLLRKLWSVDARAEVMRRRRALYRLLHGIPEGMPLPTAFETVPHPQTEGIQC